MKEKTVRNKPSTPSASNSSSGSAPSSPSAPPSSQTTGCGDVKSIRTIRGFKNSRVILDADHLTVLVTGNSMSIIVFSWSIVTLYVLMIALIDVLTFVTARPVDLWLLLANPIGLMWWLMESRTVWALLAPRRSSRRWPVEIKLLLKCHPETLSSYDPVTITLNDHVVTIPFKRHSKKPHYFRVSDARRHGNATFWLVYPSTARKDIYVSLPLKQEITARINDQLVFSFTLVDPFRMSLQYCQQQVLPNSLVFFLKDPETVLGRRPTPLEKRSKLEPPLRDKTQPSFKEKPPIVISRLLQWSWRVLTVLYLALGAMPTLLLLLMFLLEWEPRHWVLRFLLAQGFLHSIAAIAFLRFYFASRRKESQLDPTLKEHQSQLQQLFRIIRFSKVLFYLSVMLALAVVFSVIAVLLGR